MAVCRLVSRGGEHFPGGEAKTYFLPKKQQKDTPLALPCGRPWTLRLNGSNQFLHLKINLFIVLIVLADH